MSSTTAPSRPARVQRSTPAVAVRLIGAMRRARSDGWLGVLGIWAVSRLWTTTLMLMLSRLLVAVDFHPLTANRWVLSFPFSSGWDASHYRSIALVGYPHVLPRDAVGDILPNSWAFLPVFPESVRFLMAVTGADFTTVATCLALIMGAVASLLLFALVRPSGVLRARWTVALFCFSPIGFVLQLAYAETLFLALFFGAVLAIRRRYYWLTTLLGCLAAFTRPGALALALALALVTGLGMLRGDASRRDVVGASIAASVIAAAGLAWPVIATAVTGVPGAYLQTELAWWVGFVGHVDFVPLTPWFLMARSQLGAIGGAVVVGVLALGAFALTRRRVRQLGSELHLTAVSYAIYLVAVFLPQQSTFRLLLPLSPLVAASPLLDRPRRRIVTLTVCLCAQPLVLLPLWFCGYP